MSRAFDEMDLHVYEAHSLADGQGAGDGWVSTHALQQYHHDGVLPAQRLTGMQRRGLLRFDDRHGWALTPLGLHLANAFRDRRTPRMGDRESDTRCDTAAASVAYQSAPEPEWEYRVIYERAGSRRSGPCDLPTAKRYRAQYAGPVDPTGFTGSIERRRKAGEWEALPDDD